eukprot:1156625-Pelagomonas_calceolata.AAC.8
MSFTTILQYHTASLTEHQMTDLVQGVQPSPPILTCEQACRQQTTHHAAHVLLHNLRVCVHSLADGAEDDPMLRQVLPEGGGDGHRVKHGIHSHVGHALLLVQWDAQLLKGAQQLGAQPRGKLLERQVERELHKCHGP